MFGLFFVASAIFVGLPGLSAYECKKAGIEDPKECISYTWESREGVPITQEVYKQRFND